MSGYRDGPDIKPTQREMIAGKSVYGLIFAAGILVAWALGLIRL